MHTFLMVMAIMSSILLIIVVLLQDSKSGGLSGLTGGAEELFGKQKVRGAELVLQRITIVLGLIFFISLVCLTWLKLQIKVINLKCTFILGLFFQ